MPDPFWIYWCGTEVSSENQRLRGIAFIFVRPHESRPPIRIHHQSRRDEQPEVLLTHIPKTERHRHFIMVMFKHAVHGKRIIKLLQ